MCLTDSQLDGAFIFLCISGKRKSGKDFITHRLVNLINKYFPTLAISICTLSEPLKKEFADVNGLNFFDLIGDGKAKELVRKEMIEFGEKLRRSDYGIFCRKAFKERKFQQQLNSIITNNSTKFKEIILVSDCRRPTDIQFFINNFKNSKIICIRINCLLEIRQKRGFVFIEGIDNEESECSLDNFEKFDFYLNNNNNENEQENIELKNIINYLKLII